MSRLLRAAILSAVTLPLVVGCTKEFECDNVGIDLRFVNFAPAELDTLVLRRYEAGSSFRHLVDTVLLVRGTAATFRYQLSGWNSNTVTLSPVYPSFGGVQAGFDWRLVIPAASRVVAFSAIDTERSTGRCSFIVGYNCSCENPVNSLVQDGRVLVFSGDERRLPQASITR